MIISNEEFNKRMNWSLIQKIDHSLLVIENFNKEFPNNVVSFSGGVDSLVLLYLSRMLDKNRKGVYVNTTNELSEMVKFVKTIENIGVITPDINFETILEKYGFPLISKKVAKMINTVKHPTKSNENTINLYLTGITLKGETSKAYKIPTKYKHLITVPFDLTEKCCTLLKKKPFLKLNKEGCLIGTLATESLLRRQNYQNIGCINLTNKKATPLSIWTKNDIWAFIKMQNIPYCSVYDQGEKSTGCAYCGFGSQFDRTRFNRLEAREPKRYKKIMNIKNNGVTYKDAIKYTLNLNLDSYTPNMFPDLH